MILIFLTALIAVLIIANIFITSIVPKKAKEKEFYDPATEYVETAQVIPTPTEINENALITQGSIRAVNKKVELINQRLSTLENVVMTIVEKKISSENETKQIEQNKF
ncbi:MAG: hypothetical protein WCW13_01700 [archaeon]|jgi:hypothetical protein